MDTLRTLLKPAALMVVALSFTALPAAAQNRPRPDGGRAARENAPAASHNVSPHQNEARQTAPPQESRSVAPRDYGRAQAVPRSSQPAPAYRNESRRDNAPAYRDEPRRDNGRSYRYEPRRDNGHVYVAPRGYVGPRGYVAPRYHYYSTPYYRYYRAPYRPYYFGRPYYAFRPRFSIGFGLWIGFGVPYPYSYVTYAPPVYGYYNGAVGIVPGARTYGGVSFDIQPRDAAIILDGTFIGNAGDFSPNAAPLTLTPGPHTIEVQADGYQPMSWNVDIVPGQVVPFRGDMQPY